MRCRATASLAAALLATAALAGPPIAVAQIAAATQPSASDATPQTPGEAAQALRDLVDRYFAWRGPAYAQLETIHERLQIETPAGRGPGALWMDRDGRVRREMTLATGATIEASGPAGSWRIGPATAPEDPKAAERARRYAMLAFGDALTGRGGAQVSLAGRATVESHDWTVVRVTFGDADVYEALLDPQSAALGGYRITEGGVLRTELFGAWRLVDGVRMPFMELTTTDHDVGTAVTAVELNRPLDPALFQRPDAGG